MNKENDEEIIENTLEINEESENKKAGIKALNDLKSSHNDNNNI